MTVQDKLNKLLKLMEEKGDMPLDKFAMNGLIALAMVVTKDDDQKFLEFVETLDTFIETNKN